jgi:hypothetical protein
MKSESERDIKLAGLIKHGFKRIGHSALDKNRQLELKTRSRPEGLAIYLFVIKSSIRYVGKSQGLHGRFGQYSRGLLKGNLEVDQGVRAALKNHQQVSVYTLAIPKLKQYFNRKGLPVDYLIGLESGLIKRLDPEWNGRKKIIAPKNRS